MASQNTQTHQKKSLKQSFTPPADPNTIVPGTNYVLNEAGERTILQAEPQISMGSAINGFLETALAYFKGDFERAEILRSDDPFNEDPYVDPAERPDPLADKMVKTVTLPPMFNTVSGNSLLALSKEQLAEFLKQSGVEDYLNGKKDPQEVIENVQRLWDNFNAGAPNKQPFSPQDSQAMEEALEKAKGAYQKNHDIGKALNLLPGGTQM